MTATAVPQRMDARTRLAWVDAVKGAAILWIFANHVAEPLFGAPLLQNPNGQWPPLATRVDQLAPVGDPVSDAVRYVGWLGDQGVGLFLLCTGLLLTYGLVRADGSLRPLEVSRWWPSRFARLMPTYWVLLAVLLLPVPFGLVDGLGVSVVDPAFWYSVVGLRPPGTLYYGVPAFWYVSLLVQLYLLFPLVWWAARRFGVVRAVTVLLGTTLLVRLVGLLSADALLDYWSRGGIAVARLPEVLVGVLLGYAFARDAAATTARLRQPGWVLGGLVAWLGGTVLGLTLVGMAMNPVLAATGSFLLLHALFVSRRGAWLAHPASPLSWAGRHALSLFLVNQVWTILLLYPIDRIDLRISLRIMAVLTLTVFTALALETVTSAAVRGFGAARAKGPAFAMGLVTALVAVPVAMGLGAEAAVRAWAPQEVNGWGERPSLVPSEQFGWTRAPDSQTRLRWLGYDYVASANSTGFPGPAPLSHHPGNPTVLVLGDAFSSAEGVDPEEAWPWILQGRLGASSVVFNAGTTGYGPDQNARVAEVLIPRLRPDVVVVQMFVNDFEDVTLTDEDFAASIGFDQPSGDSLVAWLRLVHVTSWVRGQAEELRARLTGTASRFGSFYGQLDALSRGVDDSEAAAVAQRLARVVSSAGDVGAPVLVVMVPSSVQVCSPSDLSYQLGRLDFTNRDLWDVDGPQRQAQTAAGAAGADTFLDLRETLTVSDACPYHPDNMHWLPEGHLLVAEAVARAVESQLPADEGGAE